MIMEVNLLRGSKFYKRVGMGLVRHEIKTRADG